MRGVYTTAALGFLHPSAELMQTYVTFREFGVGVLSR